MLCRECHDMEHTGKDPLGVLGCLALKRHYNLQLHDPAHCCRVAGKAETCWTWFDVREYATLLVFKGILPVSKRSIAADLRMLGFKEDQIAGATIDGKPLLEAVADPPKKTKPKGMNKTEAEFARHLDWLIEKKVVAAYWYEPMRLKIADNDPVTGRAMYYVPDFLVIPCYRVEPSRNIIVEVKGAHIWDDAIVKFRTAREKFGKAFSFTMMQKDRSWSCIMGEPWLLG